MRVIGIDPGSRRTGWAVLDAQGSKVARVASGTIDVQSLLDDKLADGELAQRLKAIAESLEHILSLHRPDVSAVEGVFFSANAKSALVLGQARGAIILTLARAGLSVAEYAPTEIKKAVAGGGRAGKDQVQQMVKLILGESRDFREDESDAVAVAICHSLLHSTPQSMQLQAQLKSAGKKRGTFNGTSNRQNRKIA